MKGDIQSKIGRYRRCLMCGKTFPAISIVDLQTAIPTYEPHNHTYCKPCRRELGTDGGHKSV